MSLPEADLAPDLLAAAPGGAAWIVVRMRPRREKLVARFCDRQRIPVYLPVHLRSHRYGRRVRRFTLPLFPGYGFCVVDDAGRAALRQSGDVARLLEVADQDRLIEQLRDIRQALKTGAVAEVMPYLKEGARVVVTRGPLRGVEGIVQRRHGRTRVVVNVDMIHRAVAIEVDGSALAPA